MRRVLLDENLPRKLRRELTEFAVRTVQEEGWTSYANGQLLGRAQEQFDVLLTADRRLQFQQNLTRFDIGVVVILTVNLRYRTYEGRLHRFARLSLLSSPANCFRYKFHEVLLASTGWHPLFALSATMARNRSLLP